VLLKALAAGTIALSVLLFGLHVLAASREEPAASSTSGPTSALQPDGAGGTAPVTIEVWLMPDFESGQVWVNGSAPGPDLPPLPLAAAGLVSRTWPRENVSHFFGLWEGGHVSSAGPEMTGAYELCLPGLDLPPEVVLNVRLVSGIVLTDTLLPQASSPVDFAPAATGTLAITLDFTPTEAARALTATYALTGLETSPAGGRFAVSPTVELTASYVVAEASPVTAAQGVAAPPPPPFSHTLNAYGEYGLLSLRCLTRPITLTVPFYPIEKAIDLTLTPLLVETVMTHTASATGGRVGRKFLGVKYRDLRYRKAILYARAGILGRGRVRLQMRAVEDDAERSAVGLYFTFRERREPQEQAGTGYWQGSVSRLLERHLDFPSFPDMVEEEHQIGELNLHKGSVVQILAGDLATLTIQSDAPSLTIETDFELHVWQVKGWTGRTPVTPTLGNEAHADASLMSRAGDELQMRLGQIVLGPNDVLAITVKDVAWTSIDPPPDELTNHVEEGSGFTAVYRGPRSFGFDVRYVPEPAMYARQYVARLRGRARIAEHWLTGKVLEQQLAIEGGLVIQIVTALGMALVVALWIAYQVTFPRREPFRRRGQSTPPGAWKARAHPWLRAALVFSFLALLLLAYHAGSWQRTLNALHGRLGVEDWEGTRMPLAALMAGGALVLLLRCDRETAFHWPGWWPLWGAAALGVALDAWLSSAYAGSIQNALNYSSASGMLSGATSMAVLAVTVTFAMVLFLLGRRREPATLRHEDLHAFGLAALAVATFEVTDASLFAVGLLFVAWLVLSLLVDRYEPLQAGRAAEAAGGPANQDDVEQEKDTPAEREGKQRPAGEPGASPLGAKLERLLDPLAIGAVLVTAVYLSRDPLLRARLALFAPSATLRRGWIVLLDPLARLATTLAPCLAIVLLTALLDVVLERWRERTGSRTLASLDTYLKAVPLAVVLLSIFMLGIGGLVIFTGALELGLSDRTVYYLAIPLLTSVWLDWDTEDRTWKGLAENLRKNKTWLSIILALLSILAPQIISAVAPGQVDEVTKALESLRF
jgi:hypothetical protein